jgi:hypothetical protein
MPYEHASSSDDAITMIVDADMMHIPVHEQHGRPYYESLHPKSSLWTHVVEEMNCEIYRMPVRHNRRYYESMYANSSQWNHGAEKEQSRLCSNATILRVFILSRSTLARSQLATQIWRMGRHPAHKHIRQEDLEQRHRGNFTNSRHESSWLADKVVLVSRLRGGKLTKRQSKAIIRYRTESIFNLGPADEHRKDEDVLIAYQILFDDMFFFGSLQKRCQHFLDDAVGKEIHVQGQTIRDTAYDRAYKIKLEGWFHRNWDRWCDNERPLEVEITIFRTEDKNRPRRLKAYLSTLLHEMCHAYLDLWGCRFEGCYNVWEKQGVKGHGHAWQDIALAVEIAAADPNHMKLHLDLGRENSLAIEMVYERMPVPSAKELARWGMDQAEIDRVRQLVKDQHIVTKLWGNK